MVNFRVLHQGINTARFPSGNFKVTRPEADVVERLVVDTEGLVSVLDQLVDGEGGVVGFHHGVWGQGVGLGQENKGQKGKRTKNRKSIQSIRGRMTIFLTHAPETLGLGTTE